MGRKSDTSYTGRARERTTPARVRLAETSSRVLITLGGAATILAVSLILVFLVWVVVPLFTGARVESGRAVATSPPATGWLAAGVDEFRSMAWALGRDGTVRLFDLRDGATIASRRLFAPGAPACWSFAPGGTELVLGYRDGTLRAGSIRFVTSFPAPRDLPASVRGLAAGARVAYGGGMLQMTPKGQFRLQTLAARLEEPVRVAAGPVDLVDLSVTTDGHAFAALAGGRLVLVRETRTENWMTGEQEREVERIELPFRGPDGRGRPAFLGVDGVGQTVYVAWPDGLLLRYDARDAGHARVAETVDLTPGGPARVTCAAFLTGKTTLLVGDTSGTTHAWFPVKPESPPGTLDGTMLARAHRLAGADAAVAGLAPAPRSRMALVAYADGSVRLFHTTSTKLLAEFAPPENGAVASALALAPKEDAVLALGGGRARVWRIDSGHPAASLSALFGKVWYETYPEPEHVWQSSAGTDDFEEKFGLVPLVFGTLKAVLFAMLIAIPVALLAAVFTSEFLHPRLRPAVKSTVEMMAGLPSVVLGFLAALVIAPFVQHAIPETLAALFTVPLAVLVGARLWQFLPSRVALRFEGLPRLGAIFLAILAGIGAAVPLGRACEHEFFGGDIRLWLSVLERQRDAVRAGAPLPPELERFLDPAGGWAMLLLAPAALVATLLLARLLAPRLRRWSADWSRTRCAAADLARLGAGVALTLLLAWGGAQLLGHGFGWDPRGGLLGTYAQRNALIVGFVMGFAIVPVIYTLAEDALSSVPRELREASLGAGATRWQTAVRIVLPAAMSGVFGALMVGLGRAVGETMIVLMAAGNTPILEWNAFNGFRTLSANIATELPEAVRDSTHYRTLFLCALVLFVVTFFVNTAAEVVRRRFRRGFAERL